MNASINWGSPIGDISIKYRHVDQFVWKDGIWSGIIGPYDLYDLFYTYRISEYLELKNASFNSFIDWILDLRGDKSDVYNRFYEK